MIPHKGRLPLIELQFIIIKHFVTSLSVVKSKVYFLPKIVQSFLSVLILSCKSDIFAFFSRFLLFQLC